jgi:hypothetical protein
LTTSAAAALSAIESSTFSIDVNFSSNRSAHMA